MSQNNVINPDILLRDSCTDAPVDEFADKDNIAAQYSRKKEAINDSARLFTNPLIEIDMALNGGQPIYKTFLGRVEVNMLARGLIAAAMFTAASYMVKEWKMGSEEQTWFTAPLEWTANTIDKVITNPITSLIAKLPNMDMDKAEHFMKFNHHVAKQHLVDNPNIANSEVFGMTLGQAMVDVTWAFAAGSTGAAIGRNIALFLDPNYKTSWLHNGKVDFGDMLQSTAKETFRIITYNQGEDWAAAIPYLIQRKFADGMMHSSGFGNAWDLQNRDGNSHLVDKDGKIGKSYEISGLVDLQHRFPLYNTYTLMYRDFYNHVGHSFGEWKDGGFKFEFPKLPENPLHEIGEFASETVKYGLKSFIKSQIIMQPVMPFFSPVNIGITKASHSLIDETTKEFITTSPTYTLDPTSFEQMQKPFRQDGLTPAHGGIAPRINDMNSNTTYYAGTSERKFEKIENHDPYKHKSSEVSFVLNPIGSVANKYSNFLHSNVATPIFNKFGIDPTSADARWATNTFARAQLAYTPYMIAKYEGAQKLDTKDMDAAIYRGIDGIFALDLKEAAQGAADVGKAIFMQPVSPQTHANSFDPRGLINSTCEMQKKTSNAQEMLKIEEKKERYQNNIVPVTRPLNKIDSPAISGKTRDTIAELERAYGSLIAT